MSLSKRRSRPITIDDRNYRWTVSNRRQGKNDLVAVVIEPIDDGCRLVVEVPCEDRFLNIETKPPPYDVGSTTPNFVRRVTTHAQRHGWRWDADAPEIRFAFTLATSCRDNGEHKQVNWRCPNCQRKHERQIGLQDPSPILSFCEESGGNRQRRMNYAIYW